MSNIMKSSSGLKEKADFGRIIGQIDKHIRNGGRATFFDCDRVLVDPDRANATSVLMVLKEFSLKPCPCSAKEFVDICSGMGPRSVLLKLVPSLEHNLDILDAMIPRLAEIAAGNVPLIEKTLIVDYLPEIKNKDVKTGVLTNRSRIAIRPIMDKFDMNGTVDVLLYHSSILSPKPEPRMFQMSITLAEVAKKQAMFWDDNPVCVKGAKQFGMPSRLVRWKSDGASLGFEYLQD
ncbi:MAG: HAD hydrolase-like protein [Candidatus Micrarchaeota archaeon]|nr:HAD hydrolase-like protein [Candidatus Micrarchaeota archaeon]